MAKIYLSAAAHEVDNPVKCAGKCSENTHCKAYMDKLQVRLRQLGFEVMRGFADQTGEGAMRNRVLQANQWEADLYYVAHTNAGGGRYSMTMCWKDAASKAKAAVVGKYRGWPHGHKVKVRTDLYEIKATAMTCLYDELFFHDHVEDCAAFHGGWMERMVEETCRAFCELLGQPYKAAASEPEAEVPQAGDVVKLYKERLYLASTGQAGVVRTGTFYLYDGVPVKGRYRVTNRLSRVGKKPVGLNVSGWVEL